MKKTYIVRLWRKITGSGLSVLISGFGQNEETRYADMMRKAKDEFPTFEVISAGVP